MLLAGRLALERKSKQEKKFIADLCPVRLSFNSFNWIQFGARRSSQWTCLAEDAGGL